LSCCSTSNSNVQHYEAVNEVTVTINFSPKVSDSPSTKHFSPGLGATASQPTVLVYLQWLSTATPSLAVCLQLAAAYGINSNSSIVVHESGLQYSPSSSKHYSSKQCSSSMSCSSCKLHSMLQLMFEEATPAAYTVTVLSSTQHTTEAYAASLKLTQSAVYTDSSKLFFLTGCIFK
jgi:hypothetical protein